jgi:hypothetical protein
LFGEGDSILEKELQEVSDLAWWRGLQEARSVF